jgi:hypothetical protein
VIQWWWTRLTGQLAGIGNKKNEYKLLQRKFEGKEPLGRPRRSWDGNSEMKLKEIGRGVLTGFHSGY